MTPENKLDDCTEFMEKLSHETLKLVFSYVSGKLKDKDRSRNTSAKIICSMVTRLLVVSLEDFDKSANKHQQLKQVERQFADMKKEIQQQVGDAFNRAMFECYGQDLDYYCQVRLAPEIKASKRLQ